MTMCGWESSVSEVPTTFWISAEALLPQAVAQQYYGIRAFAIFLRQKIAAEQRMHAESLEEVRRDARGLELLGLIHSREIEGLVAEAGELLKGLRFSV